MEKIFKYVIASLLAITFIVDLFLMLVPSESKAIRSDDETSIITDVSQPEPDHESEPESDNIKEFPQYEDFLYIDLKAECYQLSIEEINYFLDKYTSDTSLLHHQGEAFYEASEKSGLTPMFLIAVAAQESGWEVSPLHAEKCNPYSIAMFDWDVEQGYIMGNTYSDGIINGAVWISENYYDNSQKNIYDIQHKFVDHIYASDTNWEIGVTSIMDTIKSEVSNFRKEVR